MAETTMTGMASADTSGGSDGGSDAGDGAQNGGAFPTPQIMALDRRPLLLFAALLALSLALRWPTFGDWNWYSDDQFYALVGQRVADGATLYVDIWDRKGPALFATYALIAMVSRAPIAWQLAATLAATAGALGVYRLSRLTTGARGSLMAAIAYCALLVRFDGATGEAAIFYNPLILFAAWSVATRLNALREGRVDARILLGMLAAGLAIAFKLTAVFEALWFGLVCAWLIWRSERAPGAAAWRIALLGLAGLAPMLLACFRYWQIGHFDAFWHAMALSNLDRVNLDGRARLLRSVALIGQLGLPIAFAGLAMFDLRKHPGPAGPPSWLFIGWTLVAFAAVLGYPNIFTNHALPLIAPLCILGAGFYHRRAVAPAALLALLAACLIFSHVYELPTRMRARAALAAFEDRVARVTPRGRLLVIGHTSLLYSRIGTRPPSVLAFPRHLYDGAERGVSGIDEVAEMRRILAGRPETVVVQDPLRADPRNEANLAQVESYIRRCRARDDFSLYDKDGAVTQHVYSGCGW